MVLTIAVLCVSILTCMGSGPPGGPAASDPPDTSAGKTLYDSQGCVACHTIGGKGGTLGPDLSNEASKGRSGQWLVTQLRDSKAYKPDSIMPAYSSLTNEQIQDLVAYLMSLSTEKKAAPTSASKATGSAPASAPTEHPAAKAATNMAVGAKMWNENCGRCHNYRAPSEFSDAQWAVAMHHMRLRVPLTGEQERVILVFLQASN